jgi:hypothetical protein
MEGSGYALAAYTNTNGFTSNSDVIFSGIGTSRIVPSSPENQARVTRAAMDATAAAGGDGIFWWGADIIALNNLPLSRINVNGYVDDGRGYRSDSEMGTIFGSTDSYATSGYALPVIKILGGMRGANVTKPGKMLGMTAASTAGSITLTWPRVHSAIAASYDIERSEDLTTWTPVNSPTGSNTVGDATYTDSGLTGGTLYYYRIRAVNSNGNGTWSDSVPMNTTGFIPENLRRTAATIDTVTLGWNTLAGATKYEVRRGTSASGPWTMLDDTVTGITYTDNGLTPATSYWYQVRAFDTSWGSYCIPVKVDTAALTAPTNLGATNSGDTITLTWNAVAGAASYKVYAVKSATAPAASAYTLLNSPATNTYNHSGLTDGDIWWYKVAAVWTVHGEGPSTAATSYEVGNLFPPVNAWFFGTGMRIGTGTTATTWDSSRPANQKFTQRADGILELALNQSTTPAYFGFYVEIPTGYPTPGNFYWQSSTNNANPGTTGTWVTPTQFNATEQGSRSYSFPGGAKTGKFEINPTTRQFRWVSN